MAETPFSDHKRAYYIFTFKGKVYRTEVYGKKAMDAINQCIAHRSQSKLAHEVSLEAELIKLSKKDDKDPATWLSDAEAYRLLKETCLSALTNRYSDLYKKIDYIFEFGLFS